MARKSDLKLGTRDKKVQKMSRDGAVESNLSSGGTKRISERIMDADIKKKNPDTDNMLLRKSHTIDEEAMRHNRNKKMSARGHPVIENVRHEENGISKTISEVAVEDTIDINEDTPIEKRPERGNENVVLNKARIKRSQRKTIQKKASEKSRLRFDDEKTPQIENHGTVVKRRFHEKIDEAEDENAAVQAAHKSEELAEYEVSEMLHKRFVNETERSTSHASKLEFDSRYEQNKMHGDSVRESSVRKKSEESVRTVRNNEYQTKGKLQFDETDAEVKESNKAVERKKQKKEMQKRRIKRDYAAGYRDSRRGKSASKYRVGSESKSFAFDTAEETNKGKIKTFFSEHKGAILIAVAIFLILIILLSLVGTISTAVMTGGEAFAQSTYQSSDDAIYSSNDTYSALEDNLRNKIDNIPNTYPGYDEYRYDLDSIKYDSYVLTSYLSAVYREYELSDVVGELQSLFDAQYKLETTRIVEVRTRYVSDGEGHVYPVQYNWYVLQVTLTNNGLDSVVADRMTEDQKKSFDTYQSHLGNRPYLFGDTRNNGGFGGNSGAAGLNYKVPPEALEDAEFARMITEAEKYLGYPYVWGGSDPSTSFDCSGFVSWVINHSGNGWNVGRSTANGLCNSCARVSNPKPGDLIFFQGTYDTTGASHVGIVVDPEKKIMIHCGNPIQYSSYGSSYWTQHFLGYGRLP